MTRIDKDKYSVLVRGDYLYELGRLSAERKDRDKIIAEAVTAFLGDLTVSSRRVQIEAETDRVQCIWPVGHKPEYHMYFEIINFPDALFESMDREDRCDVTGSCLFEDLGIVLNAAIRVYLEEHQILPPLLAPPTLASSQALEQDTQASLPSKI